MSMTTEVIGSRRRKCTEPVYKPPIAMQQQPPFTSIITTTTTTASTTAGVSTATVESQNSAALKRRGRETWTGPEQTMFFDGIKQMGKDFAAIARLMAKRKMKKDKEQIRNYYYNSYKQTRVYATFVEDDTWSKVPKEAKELFIMVNFSEWKRRANKLKIDPIKFRELIITGSTSVRLKRKRSMLTIRTPACPALTRFCQDGGVHSAAIKPMMPNEITLQLVPATYGDKAYVVACQQNPFIKIRMKMNDRMQRCIELLSRKWISTESRLQQQMMSSNLEVTNVVRPTIRIYLAHCMTVGRVHIRQSAAISLQLCRKVHDVNVYGKQVTTSLIESTMTDIKPMPNESTIVTETDSDTNDNNHVITDQLDASDVDGIGAEQVANQRPDIHVLSEMVLNDGIDMDNVGNMSVAELYLMCNTPIIRMVYTIDASGTNPLHDSWRIFASLISRNYAEQLCKMSSVSNSTTTVDQQQLANSPSIVTSTIPAINLFASSSAVTRTTSPIIRNNVDISLVRKLGLDESVADSMSLSNKKKKKRSTSATTVNHQPVQHVVAGENLAFKLQMEQLKCAGRKNTSGGESVVRRLVIGDTPMQPIGRVVVDQRRPSKPIDPVVIQTTPTTVTKSSTTISTAATDFSNIMTVGGQTNCESLDALIYSTDVQPSTSRSHPVDYLITPQNSVDCFSSITSPYKSTTSNGQLPDDVRATLNLMMQTNSVDFCGNNSNFSLLSSLETPKKHHM